MSAKVEVRPDHCGVRSVAAATERYDVEHYAIERRREEEEIVTMPMEEKAEVAEVFLQYGLGEEQTQFVPATVL
jgi:hypothetical protein